MSRAIDRASELRERAGSATRLAAVAPVTTTRCADQIVNALESAGVDTVYGVPGGAISTIYDALVDHPSIRVIHTRHETGALFMAIGHTRARPDSLPCVLVTSGPGVTNAITGLASALGEGAPVIVIAGEVPRSKFGRRALQEGSTETIDVVSMVRTVTRSAASVSIAQHAGFQIRAAMNEARARRGPVFLSLPLDVAVAPVQPSVLAPAPRPSLELDAGTIEAVAAALRSAAQPVLLVGSGARGASAAVRSLAERFGLPVITSPKAKGVVPETAPYCLGVFGYGGHTSATEWLQHHPPDVVLALGCGLNETSTNSWSSLLQASRTMIQVDVDPSQFGRNYHTDLAIEADCAQFLEALEPHMVDVRPWEIRSAGTVRLAPDLAQEALRPLAPRQVLVTLQEEVPANTMYTVDIGEHLLWAVQYLSVSEPDQFVASLTLGSMGSGIGAAIGAKLADPERRVVAICGDYGFQMYGMELATCVQERLGVVFLIMNDARMRMVEAGLARNYGRALPMDGPQVDFAAIAQAHGARGVVVRDVEDLRRALREAPHDEPTVLDVRIDPDARFPINGRAQEISNFTAR